MAAPLSLSLLLLQQRPELCSLCCHLLRGALNTLCIQVQRLSRPAIVDNPLRTFSYTHTDVAADPDRVHSKNEITGAIHQCLSEALCHVNTMMQSEHHGTSMLRPACWTRQWHRTPCHWAQSPRTCVAARECAGAAPSALPQARPASSMQPQHYSAGAMSSRLAGLGPSVIAHRSQHGVQHRASSCLIRGKESNAAPQAPGLSGSRRRLCSAAQARCRPAAPEP